jgi:hypothetical protein
MNVKCEVIIEFDNVKNTENILKAIEVDNFAFVKSKMKGKQLIADIESKSISSLIHTLDDYLACVSVAEKIVGKD